MRSRLWISSPTIDAQTPQILGMVDFKEGSRYADFDPKVDKVAKYGIATLVAGGALAAAAKFGLLKGLWIFILAAKKFIIIAIDRRYCILQENVQTQRRFTGCLNQPGGAGEENITKKLRDWAMC